MKHLFDSLLNAVGEVIHGQMDRDEKLMTICRLLKENVNHYDWVGFYMVDPEKERELVLGPYAGEPTEHIRIPFGKGICGQAAENKSTFTVQDVSKETNYLACSSHVKSEIVIPILKNKNIVGELDIDSHQISPFTKNDKKFLENICELISNKLFSSKM